MVILAFFILDIEVCNLVESKILKNVLNTVRKCSEFFFVLLDFFCSIDLPGDAKFASAKHRLFKLPEKSEWLPAAQLIFNGQMPHVGDDFVFDLQTTFKVIEASA